MGAHNSTPRLLQAKDAFGKSHAPSEDKAISHDAEHLNGFNLVNRIPKSSDVVVVGAGMHSLIYAIHTRMLEFDDIRRAPHIVKPPMTITIFEKSEKPSYKNSESTLDVFGCWLKHMDIRAPMLYRLFGPKNGQAFYYVASDGDKEDYTAFIANGPAADSVPTMQMERKISELLLTLFAQRLGIEIFYGHTVVTEKSKVVGHGPRVVVKNNLTNEQSHVKPRLVIDATGKFNHSAGQENRVKRFDGWNTHAYWAYFEGPEDESTIPLRYFESCNTNHICVPEGYMWIIRLPSWEGNSIESLTRMINYLLDQNAENIPADLMPCVDELVKMFDLKFRWVVSIGFAIRSDVRFPEQIKKLGSCEAERKFNWMVRHYPKIQEVMKSFKLIEKPYGSQSSYFVHKRLTFQADQVSGKGWVAIGDAVGYTNPLYSPGLNANMATSIYAAEMTSSFLAAEDDSEVQKKYLSDYQKSFQDRIPNLHQMNTFNYLCMRSPALGPLGPLWQYICGLGTKEFQNMGNLNHREICNVLTTWDWGAGSKDYIYFAQGAIRLLKGPPVPATKKQCEDVRDLSRDILKRVLATGRYEARWSGMLRWFDDELWSHPENPDRDVIARRCNQCGEWRLLCGHLACPFCGFKHSPADSMKLLID
ncbi:hypothetical protein PVAG01_07676 [Phlyctema vagabunda]|uniref:Uncharacterized protein n=1 Tax=Phlyctema vagabunda TaxID=108571 RepID=A0ABR4PD24_9HELO